MDRRTIFSLSVCLISRKNDNPNNLSPRLDHDLPPAGDSSSSENNKQKGVFISYARQDSDAAFRLYLMTLTDLKPWLDREDLLLGQNGNLEIRKIIKNSRYFIVLFAPVREMLNGNYHPIINIQKLPKM